MTDRGRDMPHRAQGHSGSVLVLVALFLLSGAGLAWVSLGIVAADRWPIRWLEVNGEFQRISAEQLRAGLAPQVNANFFTVDLKGLEETAKRTFWVSSVRAQKKWPDTVIVTVEEYEPVAHWNSDKLLSHDGKPFAVPDADEIQGLPWLEGPETRLGDVLSAWVAIDELLAKLDLEVQRLALDERGSWSLQMDNGTQVYLGRNSTEERLQRLLGSWDALMEEQDVPPRGIDLRYTNGFAVAWPGNAEEDTRNGS